ncbi:MAG: GyrI-like domain-containing protein [Erysipelotrichaceae bacterium]|nr:GyrI-like domain-containing protein [Erysipelotrichaceae bacterium]
MKKYEYRIEDKADYFPPTHPTVTQIREHNYICVKGEGNPNGEAFGLDVEILYALSYAIKMSYKGSDIPLGYYDYTVFPLEGIWDVIDKTLVNFRKDNLKYTIMIRQPEFVTVEVFEKFKKLTKSKKVNLDIEKATFETFEDGWCCQKMHIGSFDDEPASFAQMETHVRENGFVRADKTHREIYLSDPRKTDVSKMKTVLRFRVAKLD